MTINDEPVAYDNIDSPPRAKPKKSVRITEETVDDEGFPPAVPENTESNAETPAEPQQPVEMNLSEAVKEVIRLTKDNKTKVKFAADTQFYDGAVVKFTDADSDGKILAYGRLRIKNKLYIDQKLGGLSLQCCITDISTTQSSISIDINYV